MNNNKNDRIEYIIENMKAYYLNIYGNKMELINNLTSNTITLDEYNQKFEPTINQIYDKFSLFKNNIISMDKHKDSDDGIELVLDYLFKYISAQKKQLKTEHTTEFLNPMVEEAILNYNNVLEKDNNKKLRLGLKNEKTVKTNS